MLLWSDLLPRCSSPDPLTVALQFSSCYAWGPAFIPTSTWMWWLWMWRSDAENEGKEQEEEEEEKEKIEAHVFISYVRNYANLHRPVLLRVPKIHPVLPEAVTNVVRAQSLATVPWTTPSAAPCQITTTTRWRLVWIMMQWMQRTTATTCRTVCRSHAINPVVSPRHVL